MMAALATTTGRGASSSATGMMNPRTGYISIAEDQNMLKQWAANYHETAQHEQATAMSQVRHLIGVNNEYTTEASVYQQDSFLMQNELDQAKATTHSERCSAHNNFQEYAESCRKLDFAHRHCANLADRRIVP